jgi:hypothetical protein
MADLKVVMTVEPMVALKVVMKVVMMAELMVA